MVPLYPIFFPSFSTPMHSWRKFSAVRGTTLANSSIIILPTKSSEQMGSFIINYFYKMYTVCMYSDRLIVISKRKKGAGRKIRVKTFSAPRLGSTFFVNPDSVPQIIIVNKRKSSNVVCGLMKKKSQKRWKFKFLIFYEKCSLFWLRICFFCASQKTFKNYKVFLEECNPLSQVVSLLTTARRGGGDKVWAPWTNHWLRLWLIVRYYPLTFEVDNNNNNYQWLWKIPIVEPPERRRYKRPVPIYAFN